MNTDFINAANGAPADIAAWDNHAGRSAVDETVLVVVDMQPGFKAANDCLVRWFVKQEIKRAIAGGRPIIVCEFDPHEMGHTDPELIALLKGYTPVVVLTKSDDDGSKEIEEACHKHGFSLGRFRVVGVNSDGCVLASVAGLVDRLPDCQVTVVEDACNSTSGRDNVAFREEFPKMARVIVEKHGANA